MAHSASLKAACRAAYIDNMPLTQIARAQNVPLATLRSWKRRALERGDDWDKLRAANLLAGRTVQGGSTLTQQLAKNELFTQDKHLARKAAEMLAAFDLEKAYSKQQIFEMYANTIYFGSGHYGIGEAAQGYFGKPTRELTRAECVVLAGLPNAPSLYASSPELALKRTQTVLKRMVKCRVLTQMQADAIAEEAAGLTV